MISSDERRPIRPTDISIVIPVKDNQTGIDTYLTNFFVTTPTQSYPLEIIIVDNNSRYPIVNRVEYPIPVRVVECTKRGPAAARNEGVKHSKGSWILFHDSDTVVRRDTVSAYCCVFPDDCVAVQGRYLAVGDGPYAHYYAKYMSADPLPIIDVETMNLPFERWQPKILVTANCLIRKSTFVEVGGFDENIVAVASEDVELGIRLKQVGYIALMEWSVVTHNMTESLVDFCDRWIRYSRGDQYVGNKHPDDVRNFNHVVFPDHLVNEQEGIHTVMGTIRTITARIAALMGPLE